MQPFQRHIVLYNNLKKNLHSNHPALVLHIPANVALQETYLFTCIYLFAFSTKTSPFSANHFSTKMILMYFYPHRVDNVTLEAIVIPYQETRALLPAEGREQKVQGRQLDTVCHQKGGADMAMNSVATSFRKSRKNPNPMKEMFHFMCFK